MAPGPRTPQRSRVPGSVSCHGARAARTIAQPATATHSSHFDLRLFTTTTMHKHNHESCDTRRAGPADRGPRRRGPSSEAPRSEDRGSSSLPCSKVWEWAVESLVLHGARIRPRIPIKSGCRASRAAHPAPRGPITLLSEPEFALGLQQQAEVADGAERVWVSIAEGLAPPLQRLAAQRLSGGGVRPWRALARRGGQWS